MNKITLFLSGIMAAVLVSCVSVSQSASIYSYKGKRYAVVSQSATDFSNPGDIRSGARRFVAEEQPDGSWERVGTSEFYDFIIDKGEFEKTVPSNEIKLSDSGGALIPTKHLKKDKPKTSSAAPSAPAQTQSGTSLEEIDMSGGGD